VKQTSSARRHGAAALLRGPGDHPTYSLSADIGNTRSTKMPRLVCTAQPTSTAMPMGCVRGCRHPLHFEGEVEVVGVEEEEREVI